MCLNMQWVWSRLWSFPVSDRVLRRRTGVETRAGSDQPVARQAGGSLASPTLSSPVVPARRGGQSPPPYHSPVMSQIS